MAARHLICVANFSNFSAVLRNTENSNDKTSLPSMDLTLTGGEDGDYINIPDCSGKEYFKDHHISFKFTENDKEKGKFAMWFNDEEKKIYISSDGTYESGHPVSSNDNFDHERDANIYVGLHFSPAAETGKEETSKRSLIPPPSLQASISVAVAPK
ncbi:MAG TPA: hypothetical protein VF648_20725 [Pyrinomonadaceae bacterium]|jgi:hypothetical protein